MSPDFMNQIEIFNKLVDERKDEIFKLSKELNYNNSVFNYKDKNERGKTFNDFTDAINLYEKIKKGDIDLEKVRENLKKNKSEKTKIKRLKQKSDEQKSQLAKFSTRQRQTMLLKFMMITLHCCVKLDTKQNMENDIKY